jgi:hypothetical protein
MYPVCDWRLRIGTASVGKSSDLQTAQSGRLNDVCTEVFAVAKT